MERHQREAAEAAIRAEEVAVHVCLHACTCVGGRQCQLQTPHSHESSRGLIVVASMLPVSLGQEKKQESPTTIKTFASIVEGVVTAKKVHPLPGAPTG